MLLLLRSLRDQKPEFEESAKNSLLKILSADEFVQLWQKNARSKSNKNKVGELYAVKSENLIFKVGCDGHQATVSLSGKFILCSGWCHANRPFRGKVSDGPVPLSQLTEPG